MKHDPHQNRPQELSWRATLSAQEEAELRAWLAAHPAARAEWETEAELTRALVRLPDAPVASNFTARVLQAVEREQNQAAEQAVQWWRLGQWRLRCLPRAALAAVVLTAGLVSHHQAVAFRRAQFARSVAAVSDVRSLPSPEILTNFDAIYALNPVPAPDEDLLALMK